MGSVRPLAGPPARLVPEGEVDHWWSMLGSVHAVEIEIGCGKGSFLVGEAQRRPDVGFLGIEVSPKWAMVASHALDSSGVTNAAVVRADAVSFLERHVRDASVGAVHVYFPDPWPRARHEKRRIWRPILLEHVLRVLSPGGKILTATDIRGYFESIQALLCASRWLRQVHPPLEVPQTDYARKLLAAGRPVFTAMFVKLPVPRVEEAACVTSDS